MCVILLLLRLVANMFINNILIIAKMRLNLTNLRIEMHPAERPMLKAPVAPYALVDIVFSTSQTTVTHDNVHNVMSLERPPERKRSHA